jgi:hypothetical protein
MERYLFLVAANGRAAFSLRLSGSAVREHVQVYKFANSLTAETRRRGGLRRE